MNERPGEAATSSNRRWRFVIIGIFAVGISLVALTIFSQIFPFNVQPEAIPVPLESGLVADYGTDPQTFRIPALRPAIITDIARDTESEIPPRHATLLASILTPENTPFLPTATPSPPPPRPVQTSTSEPLSRPPPVGPTETATVANTLPPPDPPTVGPTPSPTFSLEKPTDAVPTLEITALSTMPPPTVQENTLTALASQTNPNSNCHADPYTAALVKCVK